jgi:tetratricopeptide (TPR) repeat protein
MRVYFDASLLVSLFVAGIALSGVARAEGGRLSGKVTDENGAPVDALHLTFTPAEEGGRGIPPAEVKKGKFAVANFPPGAYTVGVDDSKYAIKHFSLVIRGGDGIRMDQLDTDVADGTLPPSFKVAASQRADLTLVLGPGLKDVQGRSVGVAAAKATSSELKRLNDLFAKGEMSQLLKESDAVLVKDPQLGGAMYLRGVALWKLGRIAEGVEAIRKAAGLIPDQEGIQGVLGLALLDHGDEKRRGGDEASAKASFTEAAHAFEAELQSNPTDKSSLTNRVIALDKAGSGDATVEALNALVAADPSNPKVYLRKAEILTDAGKPEDALAVLAQMPSPDASTGQAMYNAAVRLYNAGKMDPVYAAMTRAVQLAPDDAHVHHLLGRVLLNRGDTKGAAKELKEFLRLAPDDPAAAEERELLKAIE